MNNQPLITLPFEIGKGYFVMYAILTFNEKKKPI